MVLIISRMNVGGPAVLIDGLIRTISSKIFEMHIIAGQCLDGELDYLDLHPELRNFAKIHRVTTLNRAVMPIKEITSFFQIFRIIKQINPDIVHTHLSKAGVLGRLATKLISKKIYVAHTFHGHLLYGYFSKFKVKLLVLVEQILAHMTDLLIAVTFQVENDMKVAGVGNERKWQVIHPGVRQPNLSNEIHRNNRILWVGRFTDIKNPMLAIEIFDCLAHELKLNYEFQMIGDGELFEQAKSAASVLNLKVDFTGWSSAVSDHIQGCTALLMTSKNEGMPLVLIESASLGIPTFSTEVGGIPEFIQDSKTGFLISQNPKLAAAKIAVAIVDNTLMQQVSLNALKEYEKGYSLLAFAEKHQEVYLNAIREI